MSRPRRQAPRPGWWARLRLRAFKRRRAQVVDAESARELHEGALR